MDLKDFVSTTIVQIAEAIKEADDKLEPLGGLVNPGTHKYNSNLGSMEFISARTAINFDVAVTSSSSKSGEGSAKLKISVLEVGVEGQAASSKEEISRLSFSTDVVLPKPDNQKKRVGLVKIQSPPPSN